MTTKLSQCQIPPPPEPFRLNITEDACGAVNSTSFGDEVEGWEWTFNYTLKVIPDDWQGEKELSVRYVW